MPCPGLAETKQVLQSPSYKKSQQKTPFSAKVSTVGAKDASNENDGSVALMNRKQTHSAIAKMDAKLGAMLKMPVIKNPAGGKLKSIAGLVNEFPEASLVDESDPMSQTLKILGEVDTNTNSQQFLAEQEAEEQHRQQESAKLMAGLQQL